MVLHAQTINRFLSWHNMMHHRSSSILLCTGSGDGFITWRPHLWHAQKLIVNIIQNNTSFGVFRRNGSYASYKTCTKLMFFMMAVTQCITSEVIWNCLQCMLQYEPNRFYHDCHVPDANRARLDGKHNKIYVTWLLTHLRWMMHLCGSNLGHWLIQVMVCRLFGVKPLYEAMIIYCDLDT